MVDTLNRLTNHHGPDCKAIIWEHNTHVGDARYTDMKDEGMLNVGQLTREQQGAENTVLVGFGTYQGTVIAAESWEAPMTQRYDAFIHIENTAALRPLHEMIARHEGDAPETYPTGY